jgi:hypothetical protein
MSRHRCEGCGAVVVTGVDEHELLDDFGCSHAFCDECCPLCNGFELAELEHECRR